MAGLIPVFIPNTGMNPVIVFKSINHQEKFKFDK